MLAQTYTYTLLQAMEGVRLFLESSTVHGLTYISTTRKYARLFWILVVITGFVGASLLIRASFQSWAESPVKTTIKTLPISEITLPKLTVCPPRNTFTDLNYDIMKTENGTLTENMRNEMFNFALKMLHESNVFLNNIPLIESDRYYNWYHGYTRAHDISQHEFHGLRYVFYTSATKGVVKTQNYGKTFQPDLVERKVYYKVFIYPPLSVQKNKNVTLHFKVEKNSMSGKGILDTVSLSNCKLSDAIKSAKTNFTPPGSKPNMLLRRNIATDDIKTIRLELMPGFRFSWWYTFTGKYVEVIPDLRYKDEEKSKLFRRY